MNRAAVAYDMTSFPVSSPDAPSMRRTHFRWVACALLFFVTANNYMDRQVLGLLAPELIKRFGWTAVQYTDVVFWFQVAYGIGFLVSGRLLDRVSTRLGLAAAVFIWSLAAALHACMGSLLGFKLVRFALGLSEPSHMPAAIKVVAEWFPRAERALATGLYKAGSNLGAIVVPMLVPWLFVRFGWRPAFLVTAATGFVWVIFWLWWYRTPEESRWVSPAELAHIRSDPIPQVTERPAWRTLLRERATWAYLAFKFLTDAMWHWYGAMFPLFLAQQFGLKIKQFGPPLIAIYLMSDGGSIAAGWLSSHLIGRGWSVTRARKLAMFICCVATLPVILAATTNHLWLAVAVVGLAHAAHQGLTSNLFTTVSDLFPRNAVGTVVGLGGTAGQIGAALMTLLAGYELGARGDLRLLFLLAGSTYLVAWVIFHFAVPSLEPLTLKRDAR